jgi:hypothetical protein
VSDQTISEAESAIDVDGDEGASEELASADAFAFIHTAIGNKTLVTSTN